MEQSIASPTKFSARIRHAGGLTCFAPRGRAIKRCRYRGPARVVEIAALAVLTQGSATDNACAPAGSLSRFRHPDPAAGPRRQVSSQERALPMPSVDGQMIRGVNELLSAVARDIVYAATQMEAGSF